jgi:hypothetical protein
MRTLYEKTARWGLACLCLCLSACATRGGAEASPQQRYLQAIAQKCAGDAAGANNALLSLASESADSRAGRRARALVQGQHWLADAAIFAALSTALSVPQQPAHSAPSAQLQGEAKQTLNALARAQGRYFSKNKRYCQTFVQCGLPTVAKAHYFYFLRPDEVMGGSDSEVTVELEPQIRAFLEAKNIRPFVGPKRYFAVAVGSNREATELDAWAVNERGTLIHLVGDPAP